MYFSKEMFWWLIAAISVSWGFVWLLFRPRRVPTELFVIKEGGSPLLRSDPLASNVSQFLRGACCSIEASGDQISILRSPSEFFSELTSRIGIAKHDIVISALYIGDGPLSKRFVQALEDRVSDRLRHPEDGPLAITILLDHNRMHHARNLVTVQSLMELAENVNSNSNMAMLDELAGLVSVRLFLYDTPSALNRWLAPFGRAKEVIGVQHTKLFIFDEKDVIISGANLSDDYFTNRIDRYMVVRGNPRLAFWCRELALTLCRLSHRVVCQAEHRRSLTVSPQKGTNGGTSPSKVRHHRKSSLVIIGTSEDGLDPAADCHAFKQLASQLLAPFSRPSFFETHTSRSTGERFRMTKTDSGQDDDVMCDTIIFPTLQFARAGIFHDSSVVEGLLSMLGGSHRVVVTSPYLNMYHGFVEQIINTNAQYDFVTASAQTNGWKGQRGFAGYIPLYYTQLERAFFFLMEQYGCSDRVAVREFSAANKTYHAKGLWVSCVDDEEMAGNVSLLPKVVSPPIMTGVGSTNYGNRSVLKDVEAEVFVITKNKDLRLAMGTELQMLFSSSVEATRAQFVGDNPGRFQPVVSLIAQLGQDFL